MLLLEVGLTTPHRTPHDHNPNNAHAHRCTRCG